MSNVRALRADLIAKGFKWIDAFDRALLTRADGSTQADFLDAAKRMLATKPSWDIYNIENNIQELASNIDRCFLYRREYFDLDAIAMKAALDIELAISTIEQQKIIETAKIASISPEILAALNSKWSSYEKYHSDLAARYSEPNGSLNFQARAEKLRAYFSAEFTRLLERLRAVELGVMAIYRKEFKALPQIPSGADNSYLSNEFLDAVAEWQRDIVTRIELERQRESVFEIIIPGRQQYRLPSSSDRPVSSSVYQMISNAKWDAAIGEGQDGYLTYDVAAYVKELGFAEQDNLRVLGVGASMSLEDPSNQWGSIARIACVIFPPDALDPSDNHAVLKRGAQILGSIGITQPNSSTKIVSGATVRNIDPRGEWGIQVSSTFGLPNETLYFRHPYLKDLKLHLQLAGPIDSRPSKWKNFFT